MSKSVEILLTNFNGGDTIALGIESIRKFTRHPYTIHVYDDGTWTEPRPAEGMTEGYRDLDYLREARDKGWIRLTEGGERKMHGKCLAALLDDCTADLAMVMDNDIQIIGPDWLDGMVEQQRKTNAAMVSGLEYFLDDNVCITSWFFMLDMAQYPAIRDNWDYTLREDGKGFRGTGYLPYKNILAQNRVIAPVPESVLGKYRHHEHIGVLSAPQRGPEWEIRRRRYAFIQSELRRLRATA